MRVEVSCEEDEEYVRDLREMFVNGGSTCGGAVGGAGGGNDNSNCNKSKQPYWNKFTLCDDDSNWEQPKSQR